jgi:hypothetical protein
MALRGWVRCAVCQGEIHSHADLFAHLDCQPPTPETAAAAVPPEPAPAARRPERPHWTRKDLKGLDIMKSLVRQYQRQRR